MEKIGFNLYLFFIVSWFLHFGKRFPVWGSLRLDLVIIMFLIVLCVLAYGKKKDNTLANDKSSRSLKYLVIFIVVTIPFVEWPGSVIKFGLENFTKAVVFFYFTALLVNEKGRMQKFILVFALCQIFRIAEPLYLHFTEGYWGSQAAMFGAEGMEMMNRLAGSRYDIINPNGLAFIIVFTLPLLHFSSYYSWLYKLLYAGSLPVLLYALALTGSRSGLLALFVVVVGIIAKAKHKVLMLVIIFCCSIAAMSILDADMADRYLSIFSSKTKNASTAQGRVTGIERDFQVALRNPLVGYGLGTSMEANSNFASVYQPSHNLYTQVMQEIGFIGLFIFMGFMVTIAQDLLRNNTLLHHKGDHDNYYLLLLNQAVLLQYAINVVFSFFSYGLSSYDWYLLAGLSVSISAIARIHEHQQEPQGAYP